MKKVLLLIGCLFMGINSTKALTLDEQGIYTNEKNVKITSEQYDILSKRFTDKTIDIMSKKAVLVFSNPKSIIKTDTEYSITTETIKNGEVIDSVTIPTTEKKAKEVAANRNLHVLSDNQLHDISKIATPYWMPEGGPEVTYETSSKRLSFVYGQYVWDENPIALMDVEWFKIPMIKKYDILAVRWNNSMPTSNIIFYSGRQSCFDKNGNGLEANYDMSSENVKITNNGFGQIMNIFDKANSELYLEMELHFSKPVGDPMYATYQHASNSNITLSQAKSYTFKSGGLGNVIYFSNSTVRKYYDGMKGVQANLY